MRIRHAVAAGSAVAALSLATTMMASVTASAAVTTQVAVHAPVAAVSAGSVGSAAGLILGLLVVLGFAGINFVIRTRVATGRRSPARVISMPESRMSYNTMLAAYAE